MRIVVLLVLACVCVGCGSKDKDKQPSQISVDQVRGMTQSNPTDGLKRPSGGSGQSGSKTLPGGSTQKQ